MKHEEECGLLELKQMGLIYKIIKALGLGIGTMKGKWMTAESMPLVKDVNGGSHPGDS